MQVAVLLVLLIGVCSGQESSTAQPALSSTTPRTQNNEATQQPQRANPQAIRNYGEYAAAGPQDRRVPTSSVNAQPRRLQNAQEQPNPARQGQSVNAPSRSSNVANAAPRSTGYPNFSYRNYGPNEPTSRSRSFQAPSQPSSEEDVSLQNNQVNYQSHQAQPRRVNSPRDQNVQPVSNAIPDEISYKPYSFNYVSDAEDGYYTHQQSGDGTGKVVGSYSFTLEDGRKRVVEYIADHNGFRANIDTNEQGTYNENPADVYYYSSAPASRSGDSIRTEQPRERPYRPQGYSGATLRQPAAEERQVAPARSLRQPAAEEVADQVAPAARSQDNERRPVVVGGRRPSVSYRNSPNVPSTFGDSTSTNNDERVESRAPITNDLPRTSEVVYRNEYEAESPNFNIRAVPGFEMGPAYNSFLGNREPMNEVPQGIRNAGRRQTPSYRSYGVGTAFPAEASYRDLDVNPQPDPRSPMSENQTPDNRGNQRDPRVTSRSNNPGSDDNSYTLPLPVSSRFQPNDDMRSRNADQQHGSMMRQVPRRRQNVPLEYQPTNIADSSEIRTNEAEAVPGSFPYYYFLEDGQWTHRH